MSGTEEDDKQFEPTPRKLEEARKKGEIARSVDLTTAASYGGLTLALATLGGAGLIDLGAALGGMIGQAPRHAEVIFAGPSSAAMAPAVPAVIGPILPWFALPAALALGAILAQRAFVVAPSRLEPKLSRISPIANAKNKFGRSGLFEFAKSLTKMTVFGAILAIYLLARTDLLVGTAMLEARQSLALLGDLGLGFLTIIVAVSAAIGLVDYLWQHAEHLRRNRMSRKEIMDELKQSEGDPHLRQARRQRAQEIALNQMMAEVPKADVVVVNPTHYAVALKWSRAPGSAPVCVAKGVDHVAARIRARAAEAGVPIHSDPPTARALYATTGIGDEIQPEHYRAVAAAIRFAEDMRQRARRGRWGL